MKQTHCKCGNEFPEVPSTGGASGYATLPTVENICYPCADQIQRDDMLFNHRPFVAYLGEGIVTTWTGGKLGDVLTSRTVKLTRESFTHGRTIQSVKVRDVHGQLWIGQSNPGIAIKLRPVNS